MLSVIVNGTKLSTKVKEATRTGCKWSAVFRTVVFTTSMFLPWYRPVILTTRTVPPFKRLTSTMSVIRVQTPPLSFIVHSKRNDLNIFVGSERTIGSGSKRSLHRVVRRRQIKIR